MPIEFPCTSCQQQLRVPDESAGKNAKCPKCGAVVVVPSALGGPPTSSAPTPQWQPQSPSPFSDSGKSAPGASPFGDRGGGSPNPYASPQAADYPPTLAAPGGPITNVPVSVEQIFNYAWQIWQVNLGLLVGVTLVAGVISNGVSYLMQGAEFALRENDAPEAALAVSGLAFFINLAVQTFVTAGQTQIVLKLIRRQPAEFSELFGGGPVFLPLYGFSLLFLLAIFLGMVLLIVPGIIVWLMWWPAYYLILERKAGVFESFSLATTISSNNWGTTFVMALLGLGIIMLGCLAFCIGVLFAAPLVAVMWATAYLMMSGQLAPYGGMPGAAMPGQFTGQPMPGKWGT